MLALGPIWREVAGGLPSHEGSSKTQPGGGKRGLVAQGRGSKVDWIRGELSRFRLGWELGLRVLKSGPALSRRRHVNRYETDGLAMQQLHSNRRLRHVAVMVES